MRQQIYDELVRDPGADQDVKTNTLFNSRFKASRSEEWQYLDNKQRVVDKQSKVDSR